MTPLFFCTLLKDTNITIKYSFCKSARKLVIAVFERLAIMGVMCDNDLFNFNGKKELISF